MTGEEDSILIELAGLVRFDFESAQLTTTILTTAKAFANPVVELTEPTATGTRTFRSLSNRHTLDSLRTETGRYRWQLRLRDGGLIGETISDYAYVPFEVLDLNLLFVTPLRVANEPGQGQIEVEMPTLVAIDLASGKRAWSREVRDTEYRGRFHRDASWFLKKSLLAAARQSQWHRDRQRGRSPGTPLR